MPYLFPSKPGRILEWEHGLIMLAIGLVLMLPDPTMVGPLFEPLLDIMPEKAWAALMFVMGVIRCAALVVNGLAPTGSPLARMAVSLMAAPIWALASYTFLLAAPVGLWAASVYVVLAGFELKIMWSAARDLKG